MAIWKKPSNRWIPIASRTLYGATWQRTAADYRESSPCLERRVAPTALHDQHSRRVAYRSPPSSSLEDH